MCHGRRLGIIVLSTFLLALSDPARAATPDVHDDPVWTAVDPSLAFADQTLGDVARIVRTDLTELAARLALAPHEDDPLAADLAIELPLPMRRGRQRFAFVRTDVLVAELAGDHPEIHTYRGRSLDRPGVTAALAIGDTGVYGIVLDREGIVLFDPAPGAADLVRVASATTSPRPYCLTDDASRHAAREDLPMTLDALVGDRPSTRVRGRTSSPRKAYRVVFSVTPSLARQIAGDATPSASSTIEWLTGLGLRASLILEEEVGIRLLVDVCNRSKPDCIADLDASSCGGQTNLDCAHTYLEHASEEATKKRTDFDFGFALSVAPSEFDPLQQVSGSASGLACSDHRARGALVGPAYHPSLVATLVHEIGHKFLAFHTFSFCAFRQGESPVEPWSGSTLMSYAGTCGKDLEPAPDTYFHAVSLAQIEAGKSLPCGLSSGPGGSPPVFSDHGTPPDIEIPTGTPFVLEKEAAGALSYTWEQMDVDQPLFRSFPPSPETRRTFPRDPGAPRLGETLPSAPREMTFRVTARAGGGSNSWTEVKVRVHDAGPLAVVDPAASASWTEQSSQIVRWSLAPGADSLPCLEPRLSLSTDGGHAFAPLATTALDASAMTARIAVPAGSAGTDRRLRVECGTHREFFALSAPFVIAPIFRIQNPNAAAIWPEGSRQRIAWTMPEVQGVPRRCDDPALFLSRDGGTTYSPLPILAVIVRGLWVDVRVPAGSASSTARLRVVCGSLAASAESEIFRIYTLPTVTIGDVAPQLGTFVVGFGAPDQLPCVSYAGGSSTCPFPAEFCGMTIGVWVRCENHTGSGPARYRLALGRGAIFVDGSTVTEGTLFRGQDIRLQVVTPPCP